jgi:predicted MPP superfamily phosphohydrolase
MCDYEVYALILSILMIAVVYIPAVVVLAKRAVMLPFGRALSPFAVWERLLLGVAAVGVLVYAYGHYVEPYWVEVTRVRLQSPKLANFSRPIRIVQISDLHCDPTVRAEKVLPGIIAAQKPDVIVFTGDAINSKGGLPNFRACLKAVASIAPTFAVDGNHDSRCWNDLALYKNTKVVPLNGAARRVTAAGQEFYVAGVGFDSENLVDKAMSSVPAGAFTLFLYHSPDFIHELAARGVDLVCAGHTHGGQVCLPWYGAIVTQSRFGKQFEAGLYHVANSWMYVNRGIGMEGGLDPRVRFCARPEVTVIDLEPASRVASTTATTGGAD